MTTYLLRRCALFAVSLVVANVLLFWVLRVLPGDPANALLSVQSTPEQVAAARALVGSDRPVGEQFTRWMLGLARFDFGSSFVSRQPVLPDVLDRLAVTLPLTVISFACATLLSVVLGFLAARFAHNWVGMFISGFSQFGVAVPVFWVGILLVWVFGLWLHVLPSGGFPRDDWAQPAKALQALVLPVTTIVIVMSASLTRYVRSAVLDVLGSDLLRTARALGARSGWAMRRHGIRNAAVPVVAVLGVELATTFLGAVVVENVFALPGIGSLLLQAISTHDLPTLQGVLTVSTLFVLLVGLCADVAQRLIDPRLRRSVTA